MQRRSKTQPASDSTMVAAAVKGATEKDTRRAKVTTKCLTDEETMKPTVVPSSNETPSTTNVPYAHRLDLTGRCFGATSLTRAPIDLSGILSDANALQAMCDDLFQPFAQSRIDMVVAVHDEVQEHRKTHCFAGAIAGAMAGRLNIALGQVSVRQPPSDITTTVCAPVASVPRTRKRGRATSKSRLPAIDKDTVPTSKVSSAGCQRVASIIDEATALLVEYRREMLPLNGSATGARILLVTDWIDNVETLLAARQTLLAQGADVVGVSFGVATSGRLLEELTRQEIPSSCSWAPTGTAQLTVQTVAEGDATRCQCESTAGEPSPSRKRRLFDAPDLLPQFHYNSTQYEANAPSEDRSVNAIKPLDPDVRLFAVFDGHGGTIAVEHLKATLSNEIFARVSSDSSSEQVKEALTQAFHKCDDALKSYLLALAPEVRMSKGFCNTGSCAVVALIVNKTLYVANVGDCSAVIGRRHPFSGQISARELSIEHNCRNAKEIKLVMERSRDRNAIRLSKDDQDTENTFGVKRVAGSLAVTRAFGDFYLKCEELSSAPFKSKVPYITVDPSISVYDLSDDHAEEQILILGSDGLWEVVGSEEAVKVATLYDSHQSALFSSSSAALVHLALEKIAHRDNMLLHELLALPRGRERRRLHDDITCTVVRITSQRPRFASVDTVEETDITRIPDEEPIESPSMM